MQLSQLFQTLSFDTLSNLVIGGEGSGVIEPRHWPRLIMQINAGLTALHSRFPLLEKELTLQLFDEVAHYFFRPEHSVSVGTDYYRYILDTPFDPFVNDILRVEQVFDELGCELLLNNESECCSLFTPSYDSLLVTHPMKETILRVSYRANHKQIALDVSEPSTVEVNIPVSHQKALCFYVAGQIYSSMNGQEHTLKGQEFLAKFEQECVFIEDKNLDNNGFVQTNIKPMLGGWR
ncbi:MULTISPECIES: hypothetical protein [Pantoea]|jgi:hypothetical protein|uniref:Uncharacterized protein n=1 Tax=Pantoea brenneri TaxID=472694 RepID=A0A7Y6NH89_9GAMM|nr:MULTISPECIES: hypothetical protein [Pantoea]MBZ6397045.1 hypothetical protein [Pantoea sp.]MBZ6440204.1 hypothetical protein [Pantoea sp.]NUY43434.1 hypothetical protein [Pantoea brenneri]NUY51000.1 hypothetical protein [Pantoea brenneri]NUY61269.1 hypothetical protein [Pantoea brenneri]